MCRLEVNLQPRQKGLNISIHNFLNSKARPPINKLDKESIKFWDYIHRAPAASITVVCQSPDTAEPNLNHDRDDSLLAPIPPPYLLFQEEN